MSPIARLNLPEDVTAPVPNPQDECDCDSLGPDGFVDRVFHFSAQQIVATLGEVEDGEEILLTLTGQLNHGTEFAGSDCILVLKKPNSSIGPAPKPDFDQIPDNSKLAQNYPNPFNANTLIGFDLPETSCATVKVFDSLGRLVTTLVDGELQAGYHSVTWNASDQASGMYFYKIHAGEFEDTRTMLLMK